jgi:serine/threonine protein kinase
VTAKTVVRGGDGPYGLTLPAELADLRDRLASETDTCSVPTPPPTDFPDDGMHSGHGLFDPTPVMGVPAVLADVPGYRVEGVLGQGGMGAVYLARQLNLDRPVALKVMSRSWARDPVFVARFVREAYAAALLNHPNVVRIYDIGEVSGTRFFSMEYVKGKTLADVMKASGKLDAETAVGYVLQAARGLAHAHDRGIIHRDIKPDNLLLDEQGTVKVADLGLVKTPDMTRQEDALHDSDSGLHTLPPDMTGARMALGTPAYMAPEQCRDAATVDHRADVYSLGGTLYTLVTGRPPFDGDSAVTLMKQHAYTPLVPPEEFAPRLPAAVSVIIQKMMAKHAGERYQTMAEVVRVLELWLGVPSVTAFQPREDQIAEVERLAYRFRTVPAAVSRQRTVSGFASGSVLFAVLLAFFGKLAFAVGLSSMVVQAAAAYFVLNGVRRKTYLFTRVRRFAGGMSGGDWVVAAGAVGLFVAFLWLSNLLWVWCGFGLLGTAAAVALWLLWDRPLDAERNDVTRVAGKLARRLKKQGVASEDVKQYFAKYSGREWEEFFEAVFGFEAKLATRAGLLRGGTAGAREKHAAWREPVVAVLNQIEAARKRERDRAFLEKSEYDRLIAAGVPKRVARERAAAAADGLVEHADAVRGFEANGITSGPRLVLSGRSMSGPGLSEPVVPDRVGAVIEVLTGKPVRAVLAAVLVAACALWVFQNELLFGGRSGGAVPLTLAGVPPAWTAWCDTANVGWGALLLLTSLYYRGERMAVLTLLGTAVTVAGHKFGISTVEPVRDYHVAMLLGTVLAFVGYRLGRR